MQSLFDQAPNYEQALQGGEDARHLWNALEVWRGTDPEGYFGVLGLWAEKRMKEVRVG